jgi:hypothetical protein
MLRARIAALKREIHELQLLAIAASVNGCEFSAAELLERAALDADVRDVLEGLTTPKGVGHRLAHLAAQPGTCVRLVRSARNGDGCIWTVEIHSDAGLLPPTDV